MPPFNDGKEERWRRRREAEVRKRKRRINMLEAIERNRLGGEVGGQEAVLAMKKATAGLLAHAGFEGKLMASYQSRKLIMQGQMRSL